MARPKKKSPKMPSPSIAGMKHSQPDGVLAQLESPRSIVVFLGMVFFVLLFIYKPIVFDGLDVQGSDVISNIGKTHQIKEFQQETGKQPLWNPYMFAGTPIYHRIMAVSWSIDTLINWLNPFIDWRVWYLWLGAIGMFLLIKSLGLSAAAGMIAALGFILIPHFHALIVVGHFSKLRALMWMPLVLLTFMKFVQRRTLLDMCLFTLIFALQMRTQHYQIIFYTILLLLFVGIVPYWKLAVEKQWSDFLKFNGYFVVSLALLILIVAQPLFVTRDYTPYSTRGGNAVDIHDTGAEKDKKGVGFDYATNWSYTVPEFWNLIIPKFHGGTSQELYTGDAVPQFRNQVIPSYWGDLPFTQSYEYLSVILAFLALVGMVFQWRRWEVKSLTLLTILALLLSLGKHFAPLYKLLFYYLPFFDKFRVPMMILTLVSFNTCVLGAFGLNYLLIKGIRQPETRRKFYILGGIYLGLLVLPLMFGSVFSLSPANEVQRYTGQYPLNQAQQLVELLKKARLDILQGSTMRSLTFFLLSGGLLFLIIRQQRQRGIWALALAGLIGLDLGLVSIDYLKGKFVDLKQLEKRSYRETELDRIIMQDKSLYRVLPPLRIVANDSRWVYYYQSIGGYSAAKLQVIQDIISNNLIDRSRPNFPVNLAVVSMLNGKYLVSNQMYRHPDLQYLGSSDENRSYLYLNKAVLPRAFFVDSVRVIEDGVERLEFMNSEAFHPRRLALLETAPESPLEAPDSSFARVTHFEPDQLTLEVYTDKQALLVLSEVYYPKGWKAVLENGDPLKIYKTNHLLRSMVIPEGRHTVTLRFTPSTYYTGIKLSWLGWLILYAGLLLSGYRRYNRQIKGVLRKKK